MPSPPSPSSSPSRSRPSPRARYSRLSIPGRDACARACPLIPPSPCGTASPGTPFCELSVNFGSLRAPVAARRISSLGAPDCPHSALTVRHPAYRTRVPLRQAAPYSWDRAAPGHRRCVPGPHSAPVSGAPVWKRRAQRDAVCAPPEPTLRPALSSRNCPESEGAAASAPLLPSQIEPRKERRCSSTSPRLRGRGQRRPGCEPRTPPNAVNCW